MARQLKNYVSLNDETGTTHTFGPEDTLPDWTKDRLGEHLFEEPEAEAQDSQREAFEEKTLLQEDEAAGDAAVDAETTPEVGSVDAEEAAPVDFTKPAPRTRPSKKQ